MIFFQMDYTDSSNSQAEDTSRKNDEDVKLFDVVRDVRDLSTPDSPDQSHQALEQCTSSNIGECQDLLQAVAVSCFLSILKVRKIQKKNCLIFISIFKDYA